MARSFWAWGDEEALPDDAERGLLRAQAQMLLGIDALAPQKPPIADQISLAAPRIQPPLDFCSTEHHDRLLHTYGRGFRDVVRGLRGDFAAAPDVVAHPTNEDQVSALLDWASAENVAVVPFGGGTSVVGGVECRSPHHNGVVSLDLKGLDKVLEVDDVSLHARIQAGATGPVLESQLAEKGLTLRHYPQSFEFSTLGGWIATRAGGHFATLYTHIDDLTAAVRMITPAGSWASRRLPGSGAGPSPDRLVLGSEGALGVITEAWMRVRPRPTHRSSATVKFKEWSAALDGVRAVAQSGLYPSNCRLLDRTQALINMVSADGTHVLLLGFENADRPMHEPMAQALAITAAHGGTSEGAQHRETGPARSEAAGKWRKRFFRDPYLQSAMLTEGILADTFETACTWSAFPALHDDLQQTVGDALRRVGGAGVLACRFTHVYPDGPAPYYTFITQARRGAELEQWAEIKTAASDTLMRHGATITHHHAVGRTHHPWYTQQRPALFGAALSAAKSALDPAGILNPGVLVDDPR